MKQYILAAMALLVLCAQERSFAQSKIKDGSVTSSSIPNTDAVMELESNHKGLLLPRVALSATNSAAPLSAHVAGMTVYNTATAGTAPNNVTPGYYYNDGSKWVSLSEDANNAGDLKESFVAADHKGWIKLDGRAISTLTAAQQSRATALGFTTNLPDATNAYLVQNGTALGSVSGSNTRTLSRNQLPNILLTLTGVTNTTGAHTHSYTDKGNTTYDINAFNGTNPIADDTESSYNTGSAGNHSHTVTGTTESLNGNVAQQTLNIAPQSLSVNVFIYLGL